MLHSTFHDPQPRAASPHAASQLSTMDTLESTRKSISGMMGFEELAVTATDTVVPENQVRPRPQL